MSKRGLLIAFEGGDGSGKSTQAKLLAERIDGVLTRQPGGTDFGVGMRRVILDESSANISPRAEAMMFMADRAEHVRALVRPSLAEGKHVVSDRWAYASFAYQGFGRGLDVEELRHLADWSMEGLWPDVVVLLDVSIETGLGRVHSNGKIDHYEAAGASLQERVVAGYREMATEDPDRWRVVPGSGSIEEVADQVWSVVAPLVDQVSNPL